MDCQHYMLTFELHAQLRSRPKTTHWPAVPDTRKIHSVGNTNTDDINLRTYTCCCVGCLRGEEDCKNQICRDEWRGYEFRSKKFVKANLDFWFRDRQPQDAILHIATVNWVEHISRMSVIRSFHALQQYVNNNPLSPFVGEPQYNLSNEEMDNVDLVALHHMPRDAPRNVGPLQIIGDGNCFPRTMSYIMFKDQSRYMEMRVRIVYEAVHNYLKYLDEFYIAHGAVNFYSRGTLPEQYAQYSENYNPYVPFNLNSLYEQEVLDICKDGAFMGIWQIFQVSNVIKCPVMSIHPNIGNPNIREDLNRTVFCINNEFNIRKPVKLMWTPMQVNKGSRPCHFVPLFEAVPTFQNT